jgi:hypothetical protein
MNYDQTQYTANRVVADVIVVYSKWVDRVIASFPSSHSRMRLGNKCHVEVQRSIPMKDFAGMWPPVKQSQRGNTRILRRSSAQ